MRKAKDDREEKMFKPTEYLTEQQVANIFSREASRRRKESCKDQRPDESDEEYLQAAEEVLDNLRDIVQ